VRGAESLALHVIHEHMGTPHGERLMFQVGDGAYFSLVEAEFREAVWMSDDQLVVRSGACEFTVMPELTAGEALERAKRLLP
jgi:hypothetical protein